MKAPHYRWVLCIAFGMSIASFLAATAYTQYRVARLDDMAIIIEKRASPGIEYLAEARSRLTGVQEALRAFLDESPASRGDPQRVHEALSRLQRHVRAHVGLGEPSGGQELWRAVLREVAHVQATVESALATAQRGEPTRASTQLYEMVMPAIDRAGEALLTTMEFTIRLSQDLAREVRQVRVQAHRTALALESVSVVLSMLAAAIVYRAFRRHEQLLELHNRLVSERADELDRFAGRVAHDILSPLSTVSLGIQALERSPSEGATGRHTARMKRAIDRVHRLVEALLAFARAGARADASARTDVQAVLSELVQEYTGSGQAHDIEISLDCPPQVEVACASGVLTSVVENLVRNAIKYMGDQAVRRIEIRAEKRDREVRIEVEDSGPGIPEDLQLKIFDPFVRGTADGDGVGLGLATVKRLIQAYDGRLGVRSKSGEGSLFWFELPRAG